MSDTPTGIAALIHDLKCADPEQMIIPELRQVVWYYKCTEEGRKKVSEYFEKIIDDAIEKAVREVAARLIALGKLTYQEIADCVDLPLSVIQEIADDTK